MLGKEYSIQSTSLDDVAHSSTSFSRPRPNPKRHEKDDVLPTVPSKCPRLNLDALFGNTDDIDEDLLDLNDVDMPLPNAASSSKKPPTRIPASDPPVVRYRRVLKHIPTVPYIPLTASDGERLYLRLLPEKGSTDLEPEPTKEIQQRPKAYKGLLGVDFQALRREAEGIRARFTKVVESLAHGDMKQEAATEENGSASADLEELTPELWEGAHSSILRSTNRKKINNIETMLWVEKYKPKGYMDLISEENVNVGLLHWLKLWDNCVFGHDYLSKHKEFKEKFANLEKGKEKEYWKKGQPQVQDEEYDELGRPKQKVVLLHGPAGLGKTTAAHIIAKHAGYNVIELNASDNRSVDVFRKILDSTTQSKSEMFQDGRPNCLVIDEIDGSMTATVEVLVNLVSGKAKETGKNKNKKILRRPIICICNDLYSPALKSLRLVALILQFQPIQSSSLVERIEEISLKEELRLDNGTLHCIAERSDYDIRSCLSTMQFIKQKNGKLAAGFLDQLGRKDRVKGVFGVWEDVFFLPQSKKYYETSDPTRGDARFHNVLRTVQNFGDYEKLQAGVFENYLKAKYRDSYFESILKSLEWNVWFMDIQHRINILQNYTLLGYLPMYFVYNHFLSAGRARFPLSYPKNNISTQSARFITNFKAQLSEILPSVGKFLNITDAILEIFPSMLTIIQPTTIRPISSQLWSPGERECLKNIVNIMMGYCLTYTQRRNNEGTYAFILEPDIEELARFPGEEVLSRKQFPYAIKQMISREIDIEKMRQEDGVRSSQPINPESDIEAVGTKTPQPTLKEPAKAKVVEEPQVAPPPIPVPNWKQPSYKSVKETIKASVAKDFFGRPIVPKEVSPEQARRLAQKAKASEIWYRFKEGYSNAVRKKLKVKDFV